jgi:hypothetical protein
MQLKPSQTPLAGRGRFCQSLQFPLRIVGINVTTDLQIGGLPIVRIRRQSVVAIAVDHLLTHGELAQLE